MSLFFLTAVKWRKDLILCLVILQILPSQCCLTWKPKPRVHFVACHRTIQVGVQVFSKLMALNGEKEFSNYRDFLVDPENQLTYINTTVQKFGLPFKMLQKIFFKSVLLNFIFIKETWREIEHGCHKNIKQNSCFQHE